MPLHSGSNLQTGSTGCHQHISKRIAQTFLSANQTQDVPLVLVRLALLV